MASVMKLTAAQVAPVLHHVARDYENSTNPEIDRTRSGENYTLSPQRINSDFSYYRDRCGQIYMYSRNDLKTCFSWIITAPKDLAPEHQRAFFQSSYEFVRDRYGGERNIVNATVHMDESQPHIHILVIPAVPNENPRHPEFAERMCCKQVINRAELADFHPSLEKHLENDNIFCSVRNGATAAGNKHVWELKAEREYTHERELHF